MRGDWREESGTEGKFLQSLYSSKFFIDIIAQNATKLVGEKENNYRVQYGYGKSLPLT